jgi:1-acyl-sn-glycerol-3-phosphate acyltransferase
VAGRTTRHRRDADHDPTTTDELLRWLYAPYNFGVFIPYLVTSTLGFGLATIAAAKVDPRVAFHFGTVWAWLLCRANFTRVTVRGREKADPKRSYVIMSNHQSHFDSLAFYGHWGRQFRWVMKQELRKVPGLGRACEDIGHIYIDRSDRAKAIASLERASKSLPAGTSIMIFPEGHRSDDGRLGELKKGGFMIALEMGLPILPLTIHGAGRVLPGKSLRLLPGSIEITVHDPIETASYEGDRDRLMADVRAAIASALPPHLRGD